MGVVPRRLDAFSRCEHTHRNGGVRDVHVRIGTRVLQVGVGVLILAHLYIDALVLKQLPGTPLQVKLLSYEVIVMFLT